MSELKKGQIVACWDRDDCDKMIRIFVCKEGEYFRCRMAGEEKNDVDRVFPWTEEWSDCIPLEEVEHGAFLSCDREIIDSLQKERDLQQKQILWLCQELNQINSGSDEMCHCPDSELRFAPKPMDCHPEGCAKCWEQASLKAVEGKTCHQ